MLSSILKNHIYRLGVSFDAFPDKSSGKLLREQYPAKRYSSEMTEAYSRSNERLQDAATDTEINQLEQSNQILYWAYLEAKERSRLIDDTVAYRAALN